MSRFPGLKDPRLTRPTSLLPIRGQLITQDLLFYESHFTTSPLKHRLEKLHEKNKDFLNFPASYQLAF